MLPKRQKQIDFITKCKTTSLIWEGYRQPSMGTIDKQRWTNLAVKTSMNVVAKLKEDVKQYRGFAIHISTSILPLSSIAFLFATEYTEAKIILHFEAST